MCHGRTLPDLSPEIITLAVVPSTLPMPATVPPDGDVRVATYEPPFIPDILPPVESVAPCAAAVPAPTAPTRAVVHTTRASLCSNIMVISVLEVMHRIRARGGIHAACAFIWPRYSCRPSFYASARPPMHTSQGCR